MSVSVCECVCVRGEAIDVSAKAAGVLLGRTLGSQSSGHGALCEEASHRLVLSQETARPTAPWSTAGSANATTARPINTGTDTMFGDMHQQLAPHESPCCAGLAGAVHTPRRARVLRRGSERERERTEYAWSTPYGVQGINY